MDCYLVSCMLAALLFYPGGRLGGGLVLLLLGDSLVPAVLPLGIGQGLAVVIGAEQRAARQSNQ
ncbi:hypothetical protein HK44_020755 [Pseudomonas fluorescens HK44]|uniref:Uncharacterized protein n=1 Tax=Pseudomonas fluorescens HK44 TaxID=1042209 RepID=A0A010T055_PSEFL|nr:hypothetical protein HK44_020755 [Pseudomonas fluorescens HK44]